MLAAFSLQDGRLYYARVQASNDVDSGYFFDMPSAVAPWRVGTKMVFPALENFSLRLAEWKGDQYFVIDLQGHGVFLVVENMPLRELGAVISFFVFRGPEHHRGGNLTVISRMPVRNGVDMSLNQGIQTRTTLSLSLPLLKRGAGPATVSLDVPYDDSLSAHIEFDLSYFVFEDAAVELMTPSFGRMAHMKSDITKTSSQLVRFRLVCSPIVAIAEGGDGILISHAADLKLDSSMSFGFTAGDSAVHAWTCHTETQNTPEIIIGDCRDRHTNALLAFPDSHMVTIPSGALGASSVMTYHFKLTISVASRAPASNKMMVSLSNFTFPTITTSFVARYGVTGTAKVNDNDRLVVQGLSDGDLLSTFFVGVEMG